MSDILNRLRDTTGIHEDLLYEAADEIGRLRDHVMSLKYDVSGQYAEIKRLQQALQIASGIISTTDGYTKQHPHAIYKDLLSQVGTPVEVDADLKDEDGFYK